MPSHLYGNDVQGLCGNCNENRDDDFRKPNNEVAENVIEFGDSWISEKYSGNQTCHEVAKPPCVEAAEKDLPLCENLFSEEIFGQVSLGMIRSVVIWFTSQGSLSGSNSEEVKLDSQGNLVST